jgi:hypothetical protein
VIALAVADPEPDPRIVEAVPAVLAWNELEPFLLWAYGRIAGTRTARRLAWLSDIALAIDRRGGFPGGCRRGPLARYVRIVHPPSPEQDAWDSLGHPSAGPPASPLWKRWKISYGADLAEFEERARHLDELRQSPAARPRAKRVHR